MNRLEEIKNEVAKANGYVNWQSYINDEPYGASDYVVIAVSERYAKECAKASLEKAAGKAKIIVSNGETHLDVKSYTLSDGIRFSPDRWGITSEDNIVLK